MAVGYEGPTRALQAYERLVARSPDVERKGASVPYTSLNGHMFSFLDKDGTMALRLPGKQREAFVAAYNTALAEQHGRVMKEFAVVPDALLVNTDDLQAWFVASHAWIGTLKPKPTKRRSSS